MDRSLVNNQCAYKLCRAQAEMGRETGEGEQVEYSLCDNEGCFRSNYCCGWKFKGQREEEGKWRLCRKVCLVDNYFHLKAFYQPVMTVNEGTESKREGERREALEWKSMKPLLPFMGALDASGRMLTRG